MRASEVDSGWLLRRAPPIQDATPELLEHYAHVQREPRFTPSGLRDTTLLLVPGIFTECYPRYFACVRRRLESLQLELVEVAMKTERPVVECAAAIRDAVLRCQKPCILLGHSKGPLDAHAALVLHPEIAPRVRALISLQAPFGGTPLATDRGPALRKLIAGAVRGLFRGSPQAFFDMSYPAREQFLSAHAATCPVPAVSLVTTTRKASWAVEPTRRYLLERYGLQSDGFVPIGDAVIPGSRSVQLQDIDHAGLALPWLGRSRYEPAALVQALLALVANA